VLCTGVWTAGLLAPLGLSLPVLPRKGQICVLERGGVTVRSKIADFAYNSTVEDADPSQSGVQTAAIIEMTRSGTILCGSSRQFAGFDTSLDRATLARIMRDCVRVVPGLADLRIIRGYAGLRPYSRDGLPAIGPVDEHGRLHIATGHEGTGHGLAPVTGAIVAARVTGADHRHAAAVDPRRLLS
jgi:glycine/D-amino acid oxidase-like deaminating enzyme